MVACYNFVTDTSIGLTIPASTA